MREFNLEPGEEVLKEVRKHWFIFLIELLPYAIMFLLPFAAPRALELFDQPFLTTIPWSDPLTHLILGAYWLIMWCGGFKCFTDYYLDAWVITNHRIVDINQRGFFNRSVSSLLLNRVQDVTVHAEGILVFRTPQNSVTSCLSTSAPKNGQFSKA